jgi:hypothetical protein
MTQASLIDLLVSSKEEYGTGMFSNGLAADAGLRAVSWERFSTSFFQNVFPEHSQLRFNRAFYILSLDHVPVLMIVSILVV